VVARAVSARRDRQLGRLPHRLADVSRLAGVILLALWAIAVATDYST
jgi:hypothetical protein